MACVLALDDAVGLRRCEPDGTRGWLFELPPTLAAGALGPAALGAGAFDLLAPAPIFQTLRTIDFADARKPRREGLAVVIVGY